MPQARLMDVNTAAIKYRNEISAGLDSRNYDKVFGACYSLNALLPEFHEDDGRQKYRITISDMLYRVFTENLLIMKCTKCPAEFKVKDIKILEIMKVPLDRFISNTVKEKIWVCLKCKADNQLLKTEMIQNTPREPFYIRVVPKPPRRQDGIQDRSDYHRKTVQWALSFRQEWEASMAQFRDDNWQKSDQVYLPSDDIDGGEENDN